MLKEIQDTIRLFKNLDYLLFKCERIFEGRNSNVDILFLDREDYEGASKTLEKKGFILYLPESVEKYKRMYVKLINSKLIAIHLHREIAWHNLVILDKQHIFSRKKGKLPSPEDSLIIHVNHIIYENFEIDPHTQKIIRRLLEKNLDWEYINPGSLFNAIIKNRQPSKIALYLNILRKAILAPKEWFSISLKVLNYLKRKISLSRKGCLISLIGANGSGKTTLTRKTLERYRPISSFFNGQSGYYFGWDPFFPLTKLLSKSTKKMQLHKQMTASPKSLKKDIILIYDFFEYLLRYIFKIYPKLRKNMLVMTDRYFYDFKAQYSKSRILDFLCKIFPAPDFVFLTECSPQLINTRKKDSRMFSAVKKSAIRPKIDKQVLEAEIRRYRKIRHTAILDTAEDIDKNIKFIIEKTWKKLT